MSLARTFLRFLKEMHINASNENKIKWLRSKGAKIGDKTRFICGVEALGTEPYMVSIGCDCLLSSDVRIFTHDGGVKVLNSLKFFDNPNDKMGRVSIGNNCFIGHGAVILPGVSIGDNVIVGAGSIVSKNVPSGVVCAGVPAKVICTIEEYYKKNFEAGNFYDFVSQKVDKRKFFEEQK